MSNVITAKVATFKTAKKYGFHVDDFAKDIEEYGWLPRTPTQDATTIQIDHFGFEDIAKDDESEGIEKISNGKIYCDYHYTLIVASCSSCGAKWGDAIDTDENSASSHIYCPDCDCQVGPEEYELDDSVAWKRIARSISK
jgi:hypothetical protein